MMAVLVGSSNNSLLQPPPTSSSSSGSGGGSENKINHSCVSLFLCEENNSNSRNSSTHTTHNIEKYNKNNILFEGKQIQGNINHNFIKIGQYRESLMKVTSCRQIAFFDHLVFYSVETNSSLVANLFTRMKMNVGRI